MKKIVFALALGVSSLTLSIADAESANKCVFAIIKGEKMFCFNKEAQKWEILDLQQIN